MKTAQLDDGPIMIIVFGCLAVTLSFISFGLGFVNLAQAKGETDKSPPARLEIAEHDRLASEGIRKEIVALQKELEQLSAQIARGKQNLRQGAGATSDDAREQLLSLQRTSTELQSEIADKEARVTDLGTQLAGKETAVKEAEFRVGDVRRQLGVADETAKELRRAIEEKEKMDVRRLGGSMKDPQFVECRKSEVVLQPQGERITVQSIKSSDARFVAAVRKKEVFFLVRPSGFESFDAALIAAENLGATVGYEPVDEDWPIKFR